MSSQPPAGWYVTDLAKILHIIWDRKHSWGPKMSVLRPPRLRKVSDISGCMHVWLVFKYFSKGLFLHLRYLS